MCLLALAVAAHPRLPLIVAANRDEFHGRPTQDARWWPDQPDILGGRDLEAGGSWLALHRSGRFAAVTNFRDADHRPAGLRSRGQLIVDFLQSTAAPVDFLRSIDGDAYAGFNLLVADRQSVAYLSNRGGGLRLLDGGIYGLSNATLDTPWHKLRLTRDRLRQLVDTDQVDASRLMRLLDDRQRAPAAEIDDPAFEFATAHALSAPFIVLPDYGTRCSTVVTIDNRGKVSFAERRFDAGGARTGESQFSFVLSDGAE